ncbi:MAG: hypothetical protein IJ204_03620 [Paludibacteraceae bacterium]|nr:hypothetical protein [Paludibacteraceae bacterium]
MRAHLQIAPVFLSFLLLAACASPTAEEYYNRGKQFREAQKPVAAMNSFIAATRVRSGEYAVKGRSFSNMATMCRMAEHHDLALALYRKSLEQFRLANDSLAQAFALNNMAWENAVLADKNAALLLIDSALALSSAEALQNKVLESRAAACLYAAQYDSVLFYTAPRLAMDSAQSTYFSILRAQAFTFLENPDSALFYARRVLCRTDNPRYLDDVYYILSHCDSAAAADEIRTLASTRADVQRTLERNNTAWMEAMLLARESLNPRPQPLSQKTVLALVLSAVVLLLALAAFLCIRHRRRINTLEYQCALLRRSPDIREELHWNDYGRFSAVCNERLLGIVDKLEQRGLPERDIRICVLVLIGFSYAEMAQILFRAENGIGKDKYLIAKRLGVSARQLQDTLQKIADSHA